MKNKIILFGKEQNKILKSTEGSGFEIVKKNPDFVVSFGGDGTVMLSEAEYPGIPKIILRNSRVCKLCSPLDNDEVLKRVRLGKYTIETYWKLESSAKKKKFLAVNDITIHNSDPRHAIRYRLSINGKTVHHEIIGDGVVISTPFGSTGYYRSITDSFFEVGIGLAFNNSTEPFDHMVLKENSEIELEITRGPAIVFADNQKKKILLKVGDVVSVAKSIEIARIVRV